MLTLWRLWRPNNSVFAILGTSISVSIPWLPTLLLASFSQRFCLPLSPCVPLGLCCSYDFSVQLPSDIQEERVWLCDPATIHTKVASWTELHIWPPPRMLVSLLKLPFDQMSISGSTRCGQSSRAIRGNNASYSRKIPLKDTWDMMGRHIPKGQEQPVFHNRPISTPHWMNGSSSRLPGALV